MNENISFSRTRFFSDRSAPPCCRDLPDAFPRSSEDIGQVCLLCDADPSPALRLEVVRYLRRMIRCACEVVDGLRASDPEGTLQDILLHMWGLLLAGFPDAEFQRADSLELAAAFG